MRDPHQNIFFYYRGPSSKKMDLVYDSQIEDNTTKGLINVLEFCNEIKFDAFADVLIDKLGIPRRPLLSFGLQHGKESSRPDAILKFADFAIYIEAKVRAGLSINQLKRHLASIDQQDHLLVISNDNADKDCLRRIQDNRLLFLSWADIHRLGLGVLKLIKPDKRLAAARRLLKHFIDYLEVVVMTEFSGLRDDDFDFGVDKNAYYVPILKRKLEALAEIIRNNLPKKIGRIYSITKVGNVSTKAKDKHFAWVAIKKPENKKDIFNQCNFTLEVSKGSLDINTVIRNGHITDKRSPIGVFYEKLEKHPNTFLDIVGKIRRGTSIVVSKRLPRASNRIMPGNEKWLGFFDMQLEDITCGKDIVYLLDVLKKADVSPAMPGVHIGYSIERGEPILAEPELLKKRIIEVIVDFLPILSFLEAK
jgi:hypothetical protein